VRRTAQFDLSTHPDILDCQLSWSTSLSPSDADEQVHVLVPIHSCSANLPAILTVTGDFDVARCDFVPGCNYTSDALEHAPATALLRRSAHDTLAPFFDNVLCNVNLFIDKGIDMFGGNKDDMEDPIKTLHKALKLTHYFWIPKYDTDGKHTFHSPLNLSTAIPASIIDSYSTSNWSNMSPSGQLIGLEIDRIRSEQAYVPCLLPIYPINCEHPIRPRDYRNRLPRTSVKVEFYLYHIRQKNGRTTFIARVHNITLVLEANHKDFTSRVTDKPSWVSIENIPTRYAKYDVSTVDYTQY